ncbi:MetQ/NlpA family ABC transporter substrate-binding protein [Paenibacillus sp. P96]|uniref:Lipoprotein n=1 Tax=Paenibacillus zeirhizosphaerae TaxID=2987519 RepID=A0ABT9FUL5_9BACL|nr:MetQ/NlpA family ABC transporter substrate-binding protein [Paenibacillus sp. P96]MDP4098429.1 MetQ/NlpA family ABC transporter substrate-binding protein [Paenibacillus sp. P96]
MKKWSFAFLSLALLLILGACGSAQNGPGATADENPGGTPRSIELKVGASAVPHAEILEAIKPELEKQGVRLQVVTFNDYVQPNVQVFDKQLDANFFQHQPYLTSENEARGMDLVSVVPVHVEPMGAYSQKFKSADEIPDGAIVGIPNDATNGGRSLMLLAKQGLITLKDNTDINSTIADITGNPKNLDIREADAAILPRQLPDLDLAVINTNYALEANLNPTKDALFIEDKDSPYANLLVARPDNKDSEGIQILAKALQSEEVKKFIEDKYQGAIVPAF